MRRRTVRYTLFPYTTLFRSYYARRMLKLKDGIPVESRPIERNQFHYIPLGVGVVISPWNFLFAIMAGTTVAAMVTGKTVLLNAASATPVIAYKFMEVLEEAGLPKGVINFIPGSGSEVGDYLVDHPRTRFVSFTGSREVGTRIFERAGVVHEDKGQKWLKRTIIDRKSTRLNSSHVAISYAVFCLKKKNTQYKRHH